MQAAARPAPDALEQVLLQASMEVGAGQDGEESDPCVDSVVTFQQHLTLDNVRADASAARARIATDPQRHRCWRMKCPS